MMASSTSSNGGHAITRFSPGACASNWVVPPSSPGSGNNMDFNYESGSILDLIAELKLIVDPSSILDVLEELHRGSVRLWRTSSPKLTSPPPPTPGFLSMTLAAPPSR